MSQARQKRASLLASLVPGFARTALVLRAYTLAQVLHLAHFRTLFDAHVLSVQHSSSSPARTCNALSGATAQQSCACIPDEDT